MMWRSEYFVIVQKITDFDMAFYGEIRHAQRDLTIDEYNKFKSAYFSDREKLIEELEIHHTKKPLI